MGFVSILKKVGQIVLQAEGFERQYSPLLGMIPGSDKFVPKIEDKLETATKIITDAEIMGQALGVAGPQKASMAAGPMFQLLLDLPIIQGKKPKDPVKAKADAEALGGALAEFLNNFEA
jgi:hypothetical protein